MKVALSEVLGMLPEGRGLFLGAYAKKMKKRYCIGQPQLKEGKIYFTNDLRITVFGLNPSFPIMIIDFEDTP